jgi:cytochrome c peroxidase
MTIECYRADRAWSLCGLSDRVGVAVIVAMLAVGSSATSVAGERGSADARLPTGASAVRSSLLPAGTELGDEIFDRPREVSRSETRGGHRSQLVVLGEMAFNSPAILGGPARHAGISCNTCHINGTTNPRLYIPGLSTLPGTFDTTGALFNPHTDDGVLDPLTTPSLRGAHLLAPYGHDGRVLSLRDFVRNVITNEFAGPEPSQKLLDALVLYIEDIDFLPNRRLTANGKLASPFSDSERRGQELFRRPFAHDPSLSCAVCHPPHGLFVDHEQHDVGSGGAFKTPTLINANFNGPYFHDGRYTDYARVVAHFDREFYLGLSVQDRRDLVAYLEAVGDGEQATERDAMETRLREISDFAAVLDTAIADHDVKLAVLAIDTIDRELRDLTELFPEPRSTSVTGGVEARSRARALLKNLVLIFRQIGVASEQTRFDEAAAQLADFRGSMVPTTAALKDAEPWSLFSRDIRDAQFAAVRALNRASIDPLSARARRPDID